MTDSFIPPEGFIQVYPKFDQEHCKTIENTIGLLSQVAQGYEKNSCGDCGDQRENWMCLACCQVFCSR